MTCWFCHDWRYPVWTICGCPGAMRAREIGFPKAWKEHQDRLAIEAASAAPRPAEGLPSGSDAKAQIDAAVLAFAEAIAHGDPPHRRWLMSAAEAFSAGKSLPPNEMVLTAEEVVDLYAPEGICPQCDRRRQRDGYKVKP